MNRFSLLVVSFILSVFTSVIQSQDVAIKSNILYDATTTINVGTEFGLSPKWTLDISGNYNPWTFSDNMKWKHWMVQPEIRYWLCQKFDGSFFGFHILGGQYNIGNIDTSLHFLGSNFSGLKDHRYEGWAIGAGIAYGYSWMLSKHWNIEAEIGVGYAYFRYDIYKCPKCGEKVESDKKHNYIGPTKAALNLVYIF